MPLLALQGRLQVAPGLTFEPVQLDVALESGDGRVDARALLRDIECREVARARDHGEHAQRPRDDERSLRFGELDVPHDRCRARQGEVLVAARVVEELPRQRRHVGRFEPQLDAQSDSLVHGLRAAAVEQRTHLTGEHRVEQEIAELLHRPLVFGHDAARRRAPAEQRELDVLEPVVELEGVEGQGRGLGRLARRRPEHLDLDRAPGRLADPELQLHVGCRGLGHGLPLASTRVSDPLSGSLGEDGRQDGKAGCHRPTGSGPAVVSSRLAAITSLVAVCRLVAEHRGVSAPKETTESGHRSRDKLLRLTR